MAKPNKMGMSSKQLMDSRAARFAANQKARSKRVAAEMKADGSSDIIDRMLAGEISKEEAAEWFRNHRGD